MLVFGAIVFKTGDYSFKETFIQIIATKLGNWNSHNETATTHP